MSLTIGEWGLILALLGAIGLVTVAAEAWGRPAPLTSRHRAGRHGRHRR